MTRAASTITVILIFVLGTWLYTKGEATVGEIVSFMGFATMLIGRMDQASGFVSRIFFQMPALADFFRVLDSAVDGAGQAERHRYRPRQGRRRVRRHQLLLRRQAAGAGAFLAEGAGRHDRWRFVGPTGAGKSTALSLLHRMWDAAVGRHPHRRHRPSRHQAGIAAPQHRRGVPGLARCSTARSPTILRIGKPDATQAELEEAARLAEAHDFILRQPQGYETLVGERGTTLSGGERQRLAIARALLKNPPILILDEATSALDSVTEARIQKALKTLMQGRTTFVIAHRLSTIRDADQVVVFEHGRIAEQGGYAGADEPRRRASPASSPPSRAGIESA